MGPSLPVCSVAQHRCYIASQLSDTRYVKRDTGWGIERKLGNSEGHCRRFRKGKCLGRVISTDTWGSFMGGEVKLKAMIVEKA